MTTDWLSYRLQTTSGAAPPAAGIVNRPNISGIAHRNEQRQSIAIRLYLSLPVQPLKDIAVAINAQGTTVGANGDVPHRRARRHLEGCIDQLINITRRTRWLPFAAITNFAKHFSGVSIWICLPCR